MKLGNLKEPGINVDITLPAVRFEVGIGVIAKHCFIQPNCWDNISDTCIMV